MNQLGTVYATKRRRRNGKSLKPSPKEATGKSNPSKRHRERLNAELDTLASLLPFEASILSKLDRLSILRLSVSYLRTKSYFQVSMHKGKEMGHIHDNFRSRDLGVYEAAALDGECFLQALNGFLVILTSDGEVFFATHSIESYLGFHQSDVVHQSVYELVHSEDREELQRQLTWNSQVPADSGLSVLDALRADHCHHLERSFTVRFRCLLDNTSGFLRLDVRGRIKVLNGQNTKSEEPPLALFALCTPFGPPSLLELPHKDTMFKSKHRLDLALVSMDQRGKSLLGYTDTELSTMGGYDLVHYDDLAYVASAHQELLKTGASGLIAYRLQTKEGQWQWLQTSSRLVYKNSKPDFIISTHRPLMEEEGRDLLGKRTMDFKVSYLDAGLASSYLMDQEVALQSQRLGRRYKSQLRDFLTTCRTKRKVGTPEYLPETPAWTPTAAAAAAAAAYPAGVYPTPMTASPATYSGENASLYMHHQQNIQTLPNLQNHLPTFYPALDNRFLSTDNLFHGYRGLAGVGGCGYYPTEYSPYVHHATAGNGFLPPGYEASVGVGVPQLYTSPGPGSGDTTKYNPGSGAGGVVVGMNRLSADTSGTSTESIAAEDCGNGSVDSHSYHRLSRAALRKTASGGEHGDMNGLLPKSNATTPGIASIPGQEKNGVSIALPMTSGDSRSNSSSNESTAGGGGGGRGGGGGSGSSVANNNNSQQQGSYAANNDTRQTVLMWGAGGAGAPAHPDSSASVVTLISDPTVSAANHHGGYSTIPSQNHADTLHEAKKYHQHHHPHHPHSHGTGVAGVGSTNGCTTPHSSLKAGLDLNLSNACKWSRMGSASPPRVPTGLTSHYLYGEAGSEVWPHHQYYSYPSYHHHHHAPHPAVDPHNSSYPSIGRSGVLCCPSPR